MPAFFLIEDVVIKSSLVVFFAILALAAGKRLRFGYFLMLVLSVTFFHLLNPWGRVLFMVGPFPVSAGALEDGLRRALTLVGMVFLSVAAVRPELELPGPLGGLLGRTFRYFDLILEGKKRLSRKNFLASLDALLLERFNPDVDDFGVDSGEQAPVHTPRRSAGKQISGVILACCAAALPWGLLVLSRFTEV